MTRYFLPGLSKSGWLGTLFDKHDACQRNDHGFGLFCQPGRVHAFRASLGRNRFLEPRRPALALAKAVKRGAEIVLGAGPIEWHPLAGRHLQNLTVVENSRFELGIVAPFFAQVLLAAGRGLP